MKYLFSIISLLCTCSSIAQGFNSYNKPIKQTHYSNSLMDSVSLEITLPKSILNNDGTLYPVIYLLDRQLKSNYLYNLQTIDYLSNLGRMPKVIIVGITFNHENRAAWTNTDKPKGRANQLISYLTNQLNDSLSTNFPLANFNLLIGHSRTAIFSSYALSKRPDFFNGAIASSPSNFDFGDKIHQHQFELFLKKIDTNTRKSYYYFSVGESTYGDAHEIYVESLNNYLMT
jgi:predicted alpha/beta superfamily hydrolase